MTIVIISATCNAIEMSEERVYRQPQVEEVDIRDEDLFNELEEALVFMIRRKEDHFEQLFEGWA